MSPLPAPLPHRPRVVVDLVPIHQGERGTGGGIWSYAYHLLHELDRLAPDDLEIVCLTHPGQRLDVQHVRVVHVERDTRSLPRRLAWIHLELPAWCVRHQASVLHKLATERPWFLPRTRALTTVQDFMPQFFRERMPRYPGMRRPPRLHAAYFEAMTRRALERSAIVLTTTNAVAAEARRRYPAAQATLVTVPLGVEHPAGSSEPPRGSRAGDRPTAEAPLRLLYVGTFGPNKGQLHAARAYGRFCERYPELSALTTLTFRGFVGEPAYHSAVRQCIADGPAAARVAFVPYDHAASPADIYRDADLLVLLSDCEGFGLPLLEAQVRGIPVLCSDLDVFREVLGDSASFVAPHDASAVADALAGLVRDGGLRKSYVRRGFANAGRFSWTRTASETLALYRQLAHGRATEPVTAPAAASPVPATRR